MERKHVVAAVIAAAFCAGCASLSGLDAQTEFGCKAPKGVSCASITAVHANANAGTLPALQPRAPQDRAPADAPGHGHSSAAPDRPPATYSTPQPLPTAQAAAPGAIAKVSPAAMNAPSSGTPVRTPERILRVWIAPFEDADGDFHDQRFMYVTVSRGQWNIERVRAAVRNQYQLVRPLSKDKDAQEAPAAKPSGGSAAATPGGVQ